MIPALLSRGFGHGSGVLSPDGTKFILNVPKNASSYVLDWSRHHGWNTALADNVTNVQQVYILLRDPLERWISGMAQYVKTYILSVYGPNGPVFPGEPIAELDYVADAQMFIDQYNDITERLVIDNAARFDDHVWPQCEIIQGILPGVPRQYFRVDHTLEPALRNHLGWRPIDGLDRNSGTADPEIRHLQRFFQHRLIIRPELKDRIRRHYQRDYELIAQVLS
jgi:hypothetical protein